MTFRLTAALFLLAGVAAAADDNKCAALTALTSSQFPNATTAIRSAVPKPASEATTGRGATPALPAHCEVFGRMNERTGANGQHYAINFHMRLPAAWNGKFFFEGGGGSNGTIGNALGNLQGQQTTNALVLGYAVVTQDSGHDNAVNNDPKMNGPQTFGFDEQARLDFGYNSYDQVTQAAKALIKLYYGKAPDRSYYVGCSEGGREAMMMSQRFPDYFDGILACSPGFKLPKAAIAEAWDTQAFGAVAKAAGVNDPNGQPFMNKTFTDFDLSVVSGAILTACDKLDGLEDGIIADFPACTNAVVAPWLDALICKGAKEESCLSSGPGRGDQKGSRRRHELERRKALCRLAVGRRHGQRGLAHLEAGNVRRASQLEHQRNARECGRLGYLQHSSGTRCNQLAARPCRICSISISIPTPRRFSPNQAFLRSPPGTS